MSTLKVPEPYRARLQSPGADGEPSVDKLARLYSFQDEDARARVERFIGPDQVLTSIALDARDALLSIFPDGAYRLDVKRDPDINDEQLVLSIGVTRDPASPRDGFRRLLAFQDAWGIEADQRAGGRITIVLASL